MVQACIYMSHEEEAKKNLQALSMHPPMPLICYITFLGITQNLDVSSLFSVEPILVFHPGISRMLEVETVEHLRCTTHRENHYKNVQSTVRIFGSLCTTTIRQLNTFVDAITSKSDDSEVGL